MKEFDKSLDRFTKQWISTPGIVAIGEGACDGKKCIHVFLSLAPEQLSEPLPKTYDGFLIKAEYSEEIHPEK